MKPRQLLLASGVLTVRTLVFGVLASGLLAPGALLAQKTGGDGFLFERPTASFSLRLGAGQPNARGGLFDFVSSDLTVAKRDYLGTNFVAGVNLARSERLEIEATIGVSGRRIPSVYRDFVDNNDDEIEQETLLQRVPLALGLRLNLVPAGRRVSQLVWVPSRLVPYVSAGAGATRYLFRQEGDFVNFNTDEIFNSRMVTKGWGPLGYVATGLTWNIGGGGAGWTVEARYDMSHASVSGDFVGFDPVSLSGIGITSGFIYRF